MKIKKMVENVFILIAAILLIWILASFVNIITNNASAGEIHTYASWNCFELLADLD